MDADADVDSGDARGAEGSLKRIEAEMKFSCAVAEMEGWSIEPFLDDIVALANRYRI